MKLTHQEISYIKSMIRWIGYGLLPWSLYWAALVLIASEVVGVIEEIGH